MNLKSELEYECKKVISSIKLHKVRMSNMVYIIHHFCFGHSAKMWLKGITELWWSVCVLWNKTKDLYPQLCEIAYHISSHDNIMIIVNVFADLRNLSNKFVEQKINVIWDQIIW